MKTKTVLITLTACLVIALNTQIGFSQSEKKYTLVFVENFNDNRNNWYTFNSDQYQVYISEDGSYVLNRPLNSFYGYTRSGVSKELNKINEGENSLLSFDIKILDTNRNGNFCFGITFDWHETTDIDCKKNEDNGGDFYLIKISGNTNTNLITARIVQRENCKNTNIINPLRTAKLNHTNKIEIERNNRTYNLIINGTVITSFVYDAKFTFDNLYAERGKYVFDNFKIQKIDYRFSSQSGFVPINDVTSKPQIYILLAGISHYNNPNYSVGQLSGPLKDITALRDFYTSSRGGAIKDNNIIFLPDEEATTDNILEKSAALFSRATQNDVIITYLSGHGGFGYFCTYDQGLQYERLNLIINRSPARKILIVDACHAGSWDASSAITSKGEKLTEQQALNLFYKQLTISGNGINWLLACRPDEYSMDGVNNGLFTELMLSGLNGAADKEGNNDDIITLDELYNYVKQKFNELNNRNYGKFWPHTNIPLKMNPVLKTSGNSIIPMAVVF